MDGEPGRAAVACVPECPLILFSLLVLRWLWKVTTDPQNSVRNSSHPFPALAAPLIFSLFVVWQSDPKIPGFVIVEAANRLILFNFSQIGKRGNAAVACATEARYIIGKGTQFAEVLC